MRASHLDEHPLRRSPVAIPNDPKHMDDTLARMFASVNHRASAAHAAVSGEPDPPSASVGWRMGHTEVNQAPAASPSSSSSSPSPSIDDAEGAALAGREARDDEEAKAFLSFEEGEIEREAETAVAAATDHELTMGHDGRLTNTARVDAMEAHRWAAMDSSQLRAELHHVAAERNKAASAVGAIARNCSGELEALYFKFKKKKQARDEIREEFEKLKKEKKKLEVGCSRPRTPCRCSRRCHCLHTAVELSPHRMGRTKSRRIRPEAVQSATRFRWVSFLTLKPA